MVCSSQDIKLFWRNFVLLLINNGWLSCWTINAWPCTISCKLHMESKMQKKKKFPEKTFIRKAVIIFLTGNAIKSFWFAGFDSELQNAKTNACTVGKEGRRTSKRKMEALIKRSLLLLKLVIYLCLWKLSLMNGLLSSKIYVTKSKIN